MIRWFQTWVRQKVAMTGGESPSRASEKKQTTLMDVAHEVLSKEASERKESLKGLEKFGWPFFSRQKKKQKIKAKVRQVLDLSLAQEDGESMVEEITEKIVEACEVDPKVARFFEGSDETK